MAAAVYEITEVGEYFPNPDMPCWYVDTERPDGSQRRHVFPKTTLAWRAAEYGIDPADTDTLLDIVLHEGFAPHPDNPLTAAADPVLAAGLLSPARASRGTTRAGDLVPTTLYNAETTEQAREAHLMRVTHAKTEVVRIEGGKGARGDLLAPIREAGVDRVAVEVFAARVDEHRRRQRGERIPRYADPTPPAPDGVDRRPDVNRDSKEAVRA